MVLRTLEEWTGLTWHRNAFVIGLYTSYLLFALALTGIVHIDPRYLGTLEAALRYYVCLFLIIRFNPVSRRRHASKKTADFDRRVAFSAGVFLLLTTALTNIVGTQIGAIKTTITRGASAV